MSDIGVEVDRVQWGVGNGGFHTEDVRALGSETPTNDPVLRLVYDCGTSRSRDVLPEEVDAWCRASRVTTATRCANVLVLSHFDDDHVNGLPLLHSAGFQPNLVVLPYLPVGARVVQVLANVAAMADSSGDEPADGDTFAVGLAADPLGGDTRALGR